jgi:regulatory protein
LDQQALEAYAVRALSRRAHSTWELRQKLTPRALAPADVDPVLSALDGRGWLDDRRFARDFARARARRRYGRYRISRELRGKQVAEEWIDAALAEVFPEEQDERALVRKRLERRLRGQPPPYPLKLLRSLYASLLRAGFSSAIIRDELFARAHGRLPEGFALEEPDEET